MTVSKQYYASDINAGAGYAASPLYSVNIRQSSSGSTLGRPKRKTCATIMPYPVPVSNPIGDWATWPMSSHTMDEIRERLTTRFINDTCISYLCRGSRIPVADFEEFCVLTSGLFHKEGITNLELIREQPVTYNKENVDYFISLFKHQACEDEPVLPVPESLRLDMEDFAKNRKTGSQFPSISSISERVDWLYIMRFQQLTPIQYAMYSKYFPSRLMPSGAQEKEKIEDPSDL